MRGASKRRSTSPTAARERPRVGIRRSIARASPPAPRSTAAPPDRLAVAGGPLPRALALARRLPPEPHDAARGAAGRVPVGRGLTKPPFAFAGSKSTPFQARWRRGNAGRADVGRELVLLQSGTRRRRSVALGVALSAHGLFLAALLWQANAPELPSVQPLDVQLVRAPMTEARRAPRPPVRQPSPAGAERAAIQPIFRVPPAPPPVIERRRRRWRPPNRPSAARFAKPWGVGRPVSCG